MQTLIIDFPMTYFEIKSDHYTIFWTINSWLAFRNTLHKYRKPFYYVRNVPQDFVLEFNRLCYNHFTPTKVAVKLLKLFAARLVHLSTYLRPLCDIKQSFIAISETPICRFPPTRTVSFLQWWMPFLASL